MSIIHFLRAPGRGRRTWLRILTVFFFGAVAEAQWTPFFVNLSELVSQTQERQLQAQAQPALIPQVSTYQRYSQTRRGREQEILVVFCLPRSRRTDCPLTLKPEQHGLSPVGLELKAEDGFTVRYRDGKKYKAQPESTPIPVKGVVFLKVRVPEKAALGTHTLKGKLTFQYGNGAKVSSPQPIDVTIPFTVVTHDADVHDNRWPFQQGRSWGDRVKLALMMPVLVPAALVFIVACSAVNCDL